MTLFPTLARPAARSPGVAVLTTAVVFLGMGGCTGGPESETSQAADVEFPIETGSYSLVATLGETAVQGSLAVRRTPVGGHGRLTLEIGVSLNIALRAADMDADSVRFFTSAPARDARLVWEDGAVSGRVDLGGGRDVQIVASPDGSYPEQLDSQLELAPLQALEPSEPSAGRAFPTLSPGGDKLLFVQYEDGDFSRQTVWVASGGTSAWGAAAPAPFSGRYSDRSPMLDASTGDLYFGSTRPGPGETQAKEDYDLWRIPAWTRSPETPPISLSVVNSEGSDYQPSLTARGDLYFVSDRDGTQDIYVARRAGMGWSDPVPLPGPVNGDGDEMSVFVAPDESYILFSTGHEHAGHLGNEDLYISRRDGDRWSAPENLGLPVNSFANEYGAFVSPDGRWLYFTSDRSPPARVYRVEADGLLEGTR